MVLNKKSDAGGAILGWSEHYDITSAEQTKEYYIKQGKQNVRIHYNQRTDMFDVIYDVKVKQ